jgi:inorganic pyrophosphatase
MDVAKIPTGRAPPADIFVVVEIPQGSAVKYEVDKESGAIFVDRFLFTATAYRLPMASFLARWPTMVIRSTHWC